MRSVEELLFDIFGGNPYYAKAARKATGGVYYTYVDEPLTKEHIALHMKGVDTYGSYPLNDGNTVKWLGWDVDSSDLVLARRITTQIISRISHLPYVVEYSGNKGYHILLFLDEPMPAQQAKLISEWVRDREGLAKSGDPHVECYPKQSFIGISTEERKNVGNLLKIPLSPHPHTHNRSVFVNPENGWEEGILLAPEEVLTYRVSPREVMEIKDDGQNSMDVLAKALSVEWVPTKRHEIALYLSGFLSQIGWSSDQALELVRKVCEITSDPEPRNREEAVRDTYSKLAEGKSVAGFQRLSELISGAAMKVVTEEAPNLICPIHAKRIDSIRLEKGAMHKKWEKVMILLWGWLTDREEGGRILKVNLDPGGESYRTYWFSAKKKTVVDMETLSFRDTLYENFHLNGTDPFVQRVTDLLIQRSRVLGDEVKLYNRSVFKDGKLYVNLGGTEIYVMDGKLDPQTIYNGDSEIFFLTSNYKPPIPDFENPIDVWSELVDKINFMENEHAKMPPAQQKALMKAWILAFFFRSLIPHRPILTLLGDPGSGKTTAIRQIIRMIEGLDKNVSGLAEDKQDSWRAMIEHNNIIALDNLEDSKARWITNELDRIATGQVIELRKLFATNELYKIRPDVFVSITAVSVPFSKATVFERMLVLNMDKLTSYTPSHVIEERLRHNINGLWGDLLLKLNKLVPLMSKEVNLAQQVRMADFAVFAARIKDSGVVNREELELGIRFLGTSQAAALAASEHSAFPIIQEWVETFPGKATKKMSSVEFFEEISGLARERRRDFMWKTPKAFSTHLRGMESILIQELGAVIQQEDGVKKGTKHITYQFPILGNVEPETSNGNGHNPFVIDLRRIARQ